MAIIRAFGFTPFSTLKHRKTLAFCFNKQNNGLGGEVFPEGAGGGVCVVKVRNVFHLKENSHWFGVNRIDSSYFITGRLFLIQVDYTKYGLITGRFLLIRIDSS